EVRERAVGRGLVALALEKRAGAGQEGRWPRGRCGGGGEEDEGESDRQRARHVGDRSARLPTAANFAKILGSAPGAVYASLSMSKRVLVANDLQTITQMLANQLRDIGLAEVDFVRDGSEALDALERGRYDAVVTDVHM